METGYVPLNYISESKDHEMPVYYEISFLIATQHRNNSQSPEIDSILDYCTGMFIIVSLFSLIAIIALINNYQFGAAFRDVYLLLLDMDVLLPLNRLLSCGVFPIAFLFAFVFSPVLQGQFFALLAKPTYSNIETLQDLYDNKYHVHYSGNIHKNIIDAGLWTTEEDMKYLHQDRPGTLFNCLELARKESSTACISVAEYIIMHASENFGLHVSKEILFPSYYVNFGRRDRALRDRVGKNLLQSFEAGVGAFTNGKLVRNNLKKMQAIERAAEFEKYDLVDGTDLIPLYMFIALIFIFAVVLFFLENIASRLRVSRLLMPKNFELEDRVQFIDENRIIIDEQFTADSLKGESLEDEWQAPTKTAKARTSDSNMITETNNRYDTLNLLDPKNNIKLTNTASHHTDTISGSSQNAEQPGFDADRGQQDNGKPLKPPPIFIIGEDIKVTSAKITSAGIKKDAVTIKQNRGSHTILAANRSTYDVIKLKLLELKVQFYTYTPKDLKPQTVVLKDIYGNYTADDIKADILEANKDIIITKIIPIVCKNSKYKKQHFIIQIPAGSKKKDLTSLKKIGSQVAHWENLIKNSVTQCKNCQRVGHTSSQCNMEYRCVKCGQSHERGKCTIPIEDNNKENLTCINCGEK
ncbi:Similar to ORF1: Nucleic-acid-binding protein from transposon X-element (Drosophila melanogaster) [Cotesia congregata]|uniref:Similar to ORF1: Nucleic-acid-binding protein from transposon X-element (Drosophila melanogaster) n=1 Tax=Cotesia congregata TaxID=51543 RepID=A0A8J2H657_COTCN|nr:Similar to ORF1: Nucleic-acid-binding protein from transposon X-element (Drosophila melanogaster) [Cotesia congregata]